MDPFLIFPVIEQALLQKMFYKIVHRKDSVP